MQSQSPWRQSRIDPIYIGFAGRMGAGKTSAARYPISKRGFQHTRHSQVLQDQLSSGGADRDRLQTLGWGIMSGGLQVELNSRLIAGLDRSRSAVIDGLRHETDFEILSSTFGASFRLTFLEARGEPRFERAPSRFQTLVAFQGVDSHPVEVHIDGLGSRASVAVSNEQSSESLYRRLDTWIATCEMGDPK